MTRTELIKLLEQCNTSRNKINTIKDITVKMLIQTIINTKSTQKIIEELNK